MIERLTVVVRVLGAIFFGFLGLRSGQALAEGDTGLVRVLYWTLTPIGFTVFGVLAAPFLITVPLQKLQEWSKTIPPLQLVPGTFAPFGTTVPGTIGPMSLVHAGYCSASNPQPSVSIRQ